MPLNVNFQCNKCLSILLLQVALFCGATPALSSYAQEDNFLRENILGTWGISFKNNVMEVDMVYNYKNNYTTLAEGVYTLAGVKHELNYRSKWKIEKGQLIEEILESSEPDFLSNGKPSVDDIVLLTRDKLKLKSEKGIITVLVRK